MNDKKKNKRYVIPDADIVEFAKDDIITVSGFEGTLFWGDDDNTEKPF